jgi:hypothetical protein
VTQRPVEGDRRATADVAWPETERALEVGIDFDRADAARIYDYLLSGGCNFAVDREQAATILARNPDRGYVCRANRVFLGRVVPRAGRRPVLLDLGSGVPTVGDVHEVALASIPTPASPTSTSSSPSPTSAS